MITLVWNRLVTSFRPDKLYIDPQVDFDESSGSLHIRVDSELPNKRVRLSREAIRKGRGSAEGRRFIIDKKEQKEFLQAIEDCEWIDNWVLVCPKQNVPDCLAKLRRLHASQTAKVAAIHVHDTPLEPRILLELKDPETLIVRQNLTTPSGHSIGLPQPEEFSSGWLQDSNHFFKLPTEPVQSYSVVQRQQRATTVLKATTFLSSSKKICLY